MILITLFALTINGAAYSVKEEAAVKSRGMLSFEELKTARLDAKEIPQVLNDIDLNNTKHIHRVYDLEEDLNTVVFQNNDGTNTMYIFEKPVKYIDSTGKIKDKSTVLVADGDSWRTVDNDVTVLLPKTFNKGVEIAFKDYRIVLEPFYEAKELSGFAGKNDTITYGKIYDSDTELVYTPTLSGLKEDIILRKYTGQSEFKFKLKTNGLKLLQDEHGNAVLYDIKGNSVASLGEVYSYDSAGNTSYGVMKIETVEDNNEYILRLIVDKGFLTDDKTVYPVVVDPTITFEDNGSSYFEHAMLYSGYPNQTNICQMLSKASHTIGYNDSTYGISRELIKFPGLAANTVFTNINKELILSVKYNQDHANGNHSVTEIQAYAYRGTSWTKSNAKWSGIDMSSSSLSSVYSKVVFTQPPTVMPSATYLDITAFAKGWKDGTYDINKGILIKNGNETDTNKKVSFYSSEIPQPVGMNYPSLQFEYLNNALIGPSDTMIEKSTMQLNHFFYPAVTNITASFSSSNTSIATVNQNGLVTAVGSGTVNIYYDFIASFSMKTITVLPLPKAVNIETSSNGNMRYNSTLALNKTLTPSNAADDIVWSSSNTSVATVNSNGVVTSKSVTGYTVIRAQSQGNLHAADGILIYVSPANKTFITKDIKFYYDGTFVTRFGAANSINNLNSIKNGTLNIFEFLFGAKLTSTSGFTQFTSILDQCTSKSSTATQCPVNCPKRISNNGKPCTNHAAFGDDIKRQFGGSMSSTSLYYYFTGHKTFNDNGTEFKANYAWNDYPMMTMQGYYDASIYADEMSRHSLHELAHKFGAVDHYCNMSKNFENKEYCKNASYCKNQNHTKDYNGATVNVSRKRTNAHWECIMDNIWSWLSTDGTVDGGSAASKRYLSEWANPLDIFCSMCREDIMNFIMNN